VSSVKCKVSVCKVEENSVTNFVTQFLWGSGGHSRRKNENGRESGNMVALSNDVLPEGNMLPPAALKAGGFWVAEISHFSVARSPLHRASRKTPALKK
jgi:hypothetical protein